MKRLIFLTLIVIASLPSDALSQVYSTKKDLSKKELKTYRKAIDASRASKYEEAHKLFDEVLKKKPDLVEAHLRKGSLYFHQKEYEAANTQFQKAISLAPEFDPEMYYSAGLVLHTLQKYDQAAYHFEAYLDRDITNKRKIKKAAKYLDNSRFAHEAVQNPVPFEPQRLSNAINSDRLEYTPMPSIDGQSLVFTRRIGGQEDFYISTKDSSGHYTAAQPIDDLNTPYNEGAHTLSADGKIMIFTSCDRRDSEGGCDLYYTRRKNGTWIEPINMGPVINSPAWESQPSLSSDGQILYFSSNRKGGLGGNDIWVSVRAGDRNGWTKPVNLGAPINTMGNDESPFIHADGYTLYYRSNGLPGMGDFDMYVARRGANAISWSAPKNLGYPINTIGNEGALSVSLDGTTAYFTSDADDLDDERRSDLDIYTFEMPPHARPQLATYLKVHIVDAVTGAPISTKHITLSDAESGEQRSTHVSYEDGTFVTSLPTGHSYSLSIEADGYLFQSRHFNLSEAKDKLDPFILKVEMIPVPVADTPDLVYDTPVALNNIFFKVGSADLKEVSMIEINRLAQLLSKNESLRIRILGHTDSTGSEEDNLALSQDRAKAVYQALIDAGIDASRLSYQGLGESDPIDTNDTAAGRQNNRRTEFILIR